MSIEGVDCASNATLYATRLKAAGIHFVCRYISTVGNPKNISAAETRALTAAGLDIVLVFETTADRALAGRGSGVADARSAAQQATAALLPGSPIYFAVDFDATPAQILLVNEYLSGAVSILGKEHVGVYGGLHVVKAALDAGICDYAWQTYAWSGGVWDHRAQLQQYMNGQSVAGLSVDRDRAVTLNYGQHGSTTAPPKPPPPPPPPPPVFDGYSINYIAKNGKATVDVVGFRSRLGFREPDRWIRLHHDAALRGPITIHHHKG